MNGLPEYAWVNRKLGLGTHRYLDLFPGAAQSPALQRISRDASVREALLRDAKVQVWPIPGFAFINVRKPAIVLSWFYLKRGRDLDLYLDLLHELTHLRQHSEGAELWDKRFSYVDRITEIEGYAVAVEEGMRLGMSEDEVIKHLHNPWMTAEHVARLRKHIDQFLARSLGL